MYEIDYNIKTLGGRINFVDETINKNWDSISKYLYDVIMEDEERGNKKRKLPFNYLLHRLTNYLLYLDNQPTHKQKRQLNFENNTEEFIEYKYNLYTYTPSPDKIDDFEISSFRNLLNVDFFEPDNWKLVLKLLRFNNAVSDNVDRAVRIFNKCYGICDFTAQENEVIRIYQKRQAKDSNKEFCIIKNIDISNKMNIKQSEVFSIVRSICKKLSDAYEILFTEFYYIFLVKGNYKFCSRCGQTKIVQEFYKDNKNSDGFQNICKECIDNSYKICSKCEQKLNKNMFSKHPNTKDGLQSWCKSCDLKQKK